MEDESRINKVIKKTGSVTGMSLDSVDVTVKDKDVNCYVSEDIPLHCILHEMKGSFSGLC